MHAELIGYQFLHPRTVPEVTAKAKRLGATLQHSRQLLFLLGRQQGRLTGSRVALEGLYSLLFDRFEPLADGSLRDAQGSCDLSLRQSLLMHLPGQEASILFAMTI